MPASERTGPVGRRSAELGEPEDADAWYAELAVRVGKILHHAQGPAKPRVPWEAAHPVPLLGSITINAGTGTLDQPDLYSVKDPYWWDVRSLAVWGFTAGTVTIYVNSTAGQQIGQITAAAGPPAITGGMFTWSAQVMLGPRDRLIFGATGITLATGQAGVSIAGQAIEVATPWLPEYLM